MSNENMEQKERAHRIIKWEPYREARERLSGSRKNHKERIRKRYERSKTIKKDA